MQNIQRVSYFFKHLFRVLFFISPILLITAWLTSPDSIVLLGGVINMSFIPRAYMATASHGSGILHALSFEEKFLGMLVSMIPMLIELFILYSLIQLFKLYENGIIFTLKNVRYIRNIAYALLVSQIVQPIYEVLMGLVLTWHNPPGHRFITITLDQTNIAIVVMALLIILVAWIMAEACKIQEEQQLTI